MLLLLLLLMMMDDEHNKMIDDDVADDDYEGVEGRQFLLFATVLSARGKLQTP